MYTYSLEIICICINTIKKYIFFKIYVKICIFNTNMYLTFYQFYDKIQQKKANMPDETKQKL